MLLATRKGRCIRFAVADEVRVFAGRDSAGVRGIRLQAGDEVISLSRCCSTWLRSAHERADLPARGRGPPPGPG